MIKKEADSLWMLFVNSIALAAKIDIEFSLRIK